MKTVAKLDREEFDWLTIFFGLVQDECSIEDAAAYMEVMGASNDTIRMCRKFLEDGNG